jgi:two-component system, NtrC family, nitrogen regulation response regulator NtrX
VRAEHPILVVDDEKNIRRTLRMVLEGEGYEVVEAGSAAEARAALAAGRVEAAIVDVMLGADSGLDLLEALKRGELAGDNERDLPVIVISGQATLADAVRATREGAFDFLEKPLDRDTLLLRVRNAVERRQMAREVASLRGAKYEMIGAAPIMQDLYRQIAKVAPTKGRVLITGESGTGKELIARAIHTASAYAGGQFVKVNCAAIPPELIESELFGHERGAFTGAVGKKRGLFEVADGGTMFLDEIGDMSLEAQAKVLRVLQTGELARVGGERTIRVDCRVIAATNKELEKEVAAGRFRDDLFFRLNVVPLRSPALRERMEDVPLLAGAFVKQCCRENGFREKRLGPGVVERLQGYPWPGNVRELRNVIERLVIMSEDEITERDLPPYLGGGGRAGASGPPPGGPADLRRYAHLPLREFRDEIEREFLRLKLDELEWNISRTAQALGIERTNLHKRLRALGIERGDGGK